MVIMEWISVRERLPEMGQNVLCTVELEDKIWWFGCCNYNGFFPWVSSRTANPIEYWMLLPEPPAAMAAKLVKGVLK